MNYQDKVVKEKGEEVRVGDLIELNITRYKSFIAENGARAVVVNLSPDNYWVRVKWIDKRYEGKRHGQIDGGYLPQDFKLIERMSTR